MNHQDGLLIDTEAPYAVPFSDEQRDDVYRAGLEALSAMLGMTVEEIEAQPERWEAML